MPFQVVIIESERGWGTKIDDIVYFNSIERADEYVKNFNKDNPSDYVPDWYMQAESPAFIREIPAGKTARDEGLLI